MTKKHAIAIALLAAVALAACGQEGAPAEGAEAGHPAPKSSSAGLPEGSVEAGKKLAAVKMGANNQSCVDCHGADGNTPNGPDRPMIGGQYADYLEHALMAYRKGDRSNITMAGQATGLSDQQIADVSAFFAAQPAKVQDLDSVN